ncbi:MAG: DJ-1/PfpI family protein [Alphaproteobacteria bacterium]|nr:DJ-1/PfpI family protein [Alphaproteobacteria bacterium]
MTFGLLVFPDVEELDFVGPWEVFTMSAEIHRGLRTGVPEPVSHLVGTVAGPIRCAKGMRVLPDCTLADAPPLDVLLVPGGVGTRPLATDTEVLAWVAARAATARWVTSVCTGALVLHAAGVSAGRAVTTHWMFADTLKAKGANVVRDTRYVRDGNLVSAAGVSAGIDMALWLIGQIYGEDHARAVQKGMEYDPAPPYGAG